MTADEAQYILIEYRPIIGFVRYRKALDIALKALEKQVPIKPAGNKCPSCNEIVIAEIEKYCPNCGQRILWEE